MGYIDGDGEVYGPVARTRVRGRCFVICTGKIGLQLELGFSSDVRWRVELRFKVAVRHGRCRC